MHDQNFKNLILDYPYQALAFFADEEANDLEKARIVPIRQEQLKERLGERFRELDTPLMVEWPNGEREVILFVLEEESENRRFSIHRLAHYCLDLAELMGTERVVPVVIFLQTGPRKKCLCLGGDRHVYLKFEYLSCDLKALSAEDYRSSDNIVARLNLPNMDYPASERLPVYAAAQTGLAQLETDPERQLKYVDFIDYYADLSEEEISTYQLQYLNEGVEIMGLAQILRQEGRQEGRHEGRREGIQQGMQEGEAAMLIRLLEKRFGTVSEPIRAQIKAADAETLLAWSERLFSCNDIEAIFS